MTHNDTIPTEALPLAGLKVVEFTHMVMGPTVGMVLGDLGADVLKIEPIGGDNTRRLLGSGAGYFPMYGRSKRSLCVDMKSPEGLKLVTDLVAGADVMVENFRPGAMDKLGLGAEALRQLNPGLVHCSAKGFLSGPYQERAALDEVAQMMGGLAYMTGPPGRPLRAGASVIDVMGGLFGVIGVLAALMQRGWQGPATTGKGASITSALFENCIFLVGQHMAQYAVTGQPARPMPVRISAWAIYELFTTKDEQQVFVGVVTDGQWRAFCQAFGLDDLGGNPAFEKNNGRVKARDIIIPRVQALVAGYTRDELLPLLEKVGLPFAPVAKPEEMFEDPQLVEGGGLVDVTLPDGTETRLPSLPISLDGRRIGKQRDLARPGQDTRAVLAEAGYSPDTIADLLARGIVAETEEA
ncbi:MAG: CaiB/BaiF CoA-transferase family protein [Azospirillaceae bacterium]|nr:CaiB/BaiF CoA-transferase family protein [Azospirillaceae bacterium]